MVGRLFRKTSLVIAVAVAAGLTVLPVERTRAHSVVDLGSSFTTSSVVTVARLSDGSFEYLVDGMPQVFLGMGYNPIYRYLSDEQRAANYDRDFRMMCEAGLNHITGWDADKGYEQDKFDELTLDYAHKWGLGVVMPFYLPADGNYDDEEFRHSLLEMAASKVARFKDFPALRMWGVGNEVLNDMNPWEAREPFTTFLLQVADLVHELDPNHPVIYRESEDLYVPELSELLQPDRPWLLYGMNVYSPILNEFLEAWPEYGLDRPLFVTEFGAEADWLGDRATGYLAMWKMIRSHAEYVLGGAPYVWTTEGPEPVDDKWGLMDGNAQPIDATFDLLAEQWRAEPLGNRCGR